MIKEHAEPDTLSEAIRYFADPDRALAFVVQLRWPKGINCPYCGNDRVSFLSSRRIWKCLSATCRKQFSVKVGTIFEDSPLGLDKWLPALWMLANAKNGISSYEVHRALGVTQKTAWFMLSRIRLAMRTKTFTVQMGGKDSHVEVDETFIGGLSKFMHKTKRARLKGTGVVDKVAVMGLLERKRGEKHSTVRADVVSSTKKSQLVPRIVEHVAPETNVYTDALKSYALLSEKDFQHAAIDHAVRYVDGLVHTNGMENFWSLLKRSIKGTYVSVDPIHLFRYVDEQAYRFNERTKNDLQRFVGVLKDVVNKRLTYKELISADMTPATT
jgi:transposase-like protein